METACFGVAERILAFIDFEKGCDSAEVRQWFKQITEWERDPHSVANPFDLTISTPSQYAVRKELAEEEAAERDASKLFSLGPGLSPSELMARGIDLQSEM